MKELLIVGIIVVITLLISFYNHKYRVSQGQKIIYSKINHTYIWVDKDGKP